MAYAWSRVYSAVVTDPGAVDYEMNLVIDPAGPSPYMFNNISPVGVCGGSPINNASSTSCGNVDANISGAAPNWTLDVMP